MFLFSFNTLELIILMVAAVFLITYGKKIFGAFYKGSDFVKEETGEAERIRALKNHITPICIIAHSPHDKSLTARANTERELLQKNDNPFDDAIPICVFIPDRVFYTEVGGKQISADLRSLSYASYVLKASQTFSEICQLYEAELKSKNIATEEQIQQLMYGQKPLYKSPKNYSL